MNYKASAFGYYAFICILINLPSGYYAEFIISSSAAYFGTAVLSLSYATYEYTKCIYSECCNDKWIKADIKGLQLALKSKLHGQHLVEQVLIPSLRGHLQRKHPEKALVMSFNGVTGSGKNYVAKIIAEYLYEKGEHSKYVHWFIGTSHFPHTDEVKEYRNMLSKKITAATKSCGRSLFVFDEVDKMPEGVIDAIKPFMDYYSSVDGIDFRKNIFIFLSNAGGSAITNTALKFWTEGEERTEIKMKDIEPLISIGAFNEEGGLRHSNIIHKKLIDTYIPFLPLEKIHVIKCVEDEMEKRHLPVSGLVVRKVANELEYYPKEFKLYSSSGCKRIANKVDVATDSE